MSKQLSERGKKIVENTIVKIKSGEISVKEGYDKFMDGWFGNKTYSYFIDRIIELNMINVNEKSLFSVNSRDLWK